MVLVVVELVKVEVDGGVSLVASELSDAQGEVNSAVAVVGSFWWLISLLGWTGLLSGGDGEGDGLLRPYVKRLS